MMKTILVGITLSTMAATPAMALEVTKSIEIAVPPEAVWKTIGEFCGIGDWHPAIEKCEPSEKSGKKLRSLTLKGGGGTILEEQEDRNDKKMSYTYTILEGPLPVANYKSTIHVMKDGKGSKVTWEGNFKAKGAPDDKAKEAISGVYEAGLKGISEKAK